MLKHNSFYLVIIFIFAGLFGLGKVYAQPPNDLCVDAIEVFNGVTSFSNIGANTDGPPFGCGSGGSDIWYVYTATCTGDVLFSLCNDGAQPPTDYDSIMQVYNTNSCAELNDVFSDCDDDGCEFSGPSFVEFPVQIGNQYIVRIGGFIGLTGNGHLEIVPQENCSESGAVRNVPTLSEWGLIAMAGILGIVGFLVMRRRRVAA